MLAAPRPARSCRITRPLLTARVARPGQDVFLEGPHWSRIRLPPKSVYFLSRYHQRVTYHDDAVHAAAAAGALGIGPINTSAFGGRGGRAGHARTTCDMTTSAYRMWHQSLCNTANWGAYDAYVIRLERPLGAAELDLFNYPQACRTYSRLVRWAYSRLTLQARTYLPACRTDALFTHNDLNIIDARPERVGRRERLPAHLARRLRLPRDQPVSLSPRGAHALRAADAIRCAHRWRSATRQEGAIGRSMASRQPPLLHSPAARLTCTHLGYFPRQLVAERVRAKLEAMGIQTGMDTGQMGKITLPVTRLPGLRTPVRTPASAARWKS